MHNAAFDDQMERWGHLIQGVAEHASDAAFLQPDQEGLIQARKEAWEAKQRQLRHRAAAQQATRDLEAAMARAQEAATRLHHGLLGKYGATNPKLVAFGMHPRRVGKARAHSAAVLETLRAAAVAALEGGAPPHRATEPVFDAAAPPTVGGNAPRVEKDAVRAGGAVPQADADAAALSRIARPEGERLPKQKRRPLPSGERLPRLLKPRQSRLEVVR
ncbi:MAG TPA: hypothetical protein VNW71_05450 [Thermoanaerobaculia bacterium]|nr:hypothetical protein [Thermoanaerobaculia bacterium]